MIKIKERKEMEEYFKKEKKKWEKMLEKVNKKKVE